MRRALTTRRAERGLRALTTAGCLFLVPIESAAQNPPAGAVVSEPLSVTGSIPSDRFIDRHTPIELTLSRPLLPNEGSIAVMIGSVDVSDLLERGTARVVYRPRLAPLPAGERELVVYRRNGAVWVELQRFVIKVLRKGGLVRVSLTPSATLGNSGQIAEGHSADVAAPARTTFQDFTVTSGMRSSHEGVAWSLETQSNIVGASRQEQTLRFAQRGVAAPKIDLADYMITLRARGVRLSAGHVSVGTNRHLINAFGSRGLTLVVNAGPASVSLGALRGSSLVGWSHLIGLEQPNHRVMSAALGTEIVPGRPGALRVDVSLLNGSLLPQTGFTEGAVVDAEQSSGVGVEISGTSLDQRVRISSGYSRSSFTNPPRDPQLLGDSAVRRVRRETRGARYVELSLAVLRSAELPLLGLASLNTTYRHERVDPLYRSVAVATQADMHQNAFDVTANVGLLAGQLSVARSHDNLDRVPSVLRTLNRQANASFALALPSVTRLRKAAAILPALSYTLGSTHQLAAGTPTNGDFRPSDLPDQVSRTHSAEALWQVGRWRWAYRLSTSKQDNRQSQRERADFAAQAHAVNLGIALGTAVDLGVDASSEQQHALERDETARVRRIGFGVNWRPRGTTTVIASLNAVYSQDASRLKGSRNGETRVELSQSVGRVTGGSRGQLFLRYALTSAFIPNSDSGFAAQSQRQWTLSSGLSVKVF